jgi:predicted AlkP superfamily phosphohydrolase/phosphomutase
MPERTRFTLTFLALALSTACSHPPARKVIVIGVDGMDPGFVQSHWNSLPNLSELRRRGAFSPLTTTDPPQSPVAWTTFITGLDPSAHGVFDFVHRNPATLESESSFGRVAQPSLQLPLGPYLLPLWPARAERLYSGTPFWQLLASHDVPATIYRVPNNYPPVQAGQALAGMGTPDLRGTPGTFTYFTSDPEQLTHSVPGGEIVHVDPFHGEVTLTLQGPPNPLRADHKPATAEIQVDIDPEEDGARFTSGRDMAVLQPGEWSSWLSAEFPFMPGIASARGIFRIFVVELHPYFRVYVSPLNADPTDPALPLSYPSNFVRNIASRIGRFYTTGIPEDTAALRQGIFNLPQFLSQSNLAAKDEHRLFTDALAHYHDGLLFFYFSTLDQNSHVLFGIRDDQLLQTYQSIDNAIGEAVHAHPGADFIVLSDHGFTTFNRAVHLNRWLADHDWLVTHTATAAGIDWSRTQAYAFGLNGLYLNLAGREAHGIVHPGPEARHLLDEIRAALLAWRDPADGNPIVESVTEPNPAPSLANRAPDLIIGYAPGYRASWRTALGDAPNREIKDNTDPWVADHCVNPARVPGVLFTTLPLHAASPALKDLPVSILHLYRLTPPPEMTGKNLF